MKQFIIYLLLIVPFSVTAQSTPEELFGKGLEMVTKAKLDSGIYYYDQAIALKPNYHEAFFRRGLAWDKKGDIAKAIADYTSAISIFEKPVYYNNRGIDYSITADFDKAMADYDKAISIDPTYGQSFLNKGYIYVQQNNNNLACDNFRKAKELGLYMAEEAINYYCK
ncbi:MAG: tetratricopeptide repeat protein [Bacteroidota bacterium]